MQAPLNLSMLGLPYKHVEKDLAGLIVFIGKWRIHVCPLATSCVWRTAARWPVPALGRGRGASVCRPRRTAVWSHRGHALGECST